MLLPTLFSVSLEKAGPKHSTRVPFSTGTAVPLSVDVKKVALVPNPDSVVTVKGLLVPQGPGALAVLCSSVHSLIPPTLQIVIPFLFPVTVHLKVKVSPGQVGGGAVSCPATSPGSEYIHLPVKSLDFFCYVTHTTVHHMYRNCM